MKLKPLRDRLAIRSILILAVFLTTATSPAGSQEIQEVRSMYFPGQAAAAQDAGTPACPDDLCPGLGNAFYLPGLNALSINTGGTVFFTKRKIKECAEYHPVTTKTSRTLSAEDSMNSFVKTVSTNIQLNGSFSSNQLSVQSTAQAMTGKESSYTGRFHSTTLDVSQVFSTVDFKQTSQCFGAANIHPDFLKAFEALPLIDPTKVADPASWDAYVQFLKGGGSGRSHIMIQQQIGSRFQQWESSTSQESNIASLLKAKACAEVEGVKGETGWSVSGCSAYSEEERRKALRTTSHNQTVIQGGTEKARNDLTRKIDQQTLGRFIDSGAQGNQAIRFIFTPIWSLLDGVYSPACANAGVGSPACNNLQRVRNLQAAYEGWLAIQCPRLSSGGVVYQQMRIAGTDTLGINIYECRAKKTGCVTNGDCRMAPDSTCFCYGPTCLDTGEKIAGTPYHRTRVRGSKSGGTREGVNNSCYYKFLAHCNCDKSWLGGLEDRALYLQSAN